MYATLHTDLCRLNKAEMVESHGFPYYGYTMVVESNGVRRATIYLRSDLPALVTRSVLAHEQYHSQDPEFLTSSVFTRELKANVAGFKETPVGFFQGFFMSLFDVDRVVLYFKRIVGNF